VERIGYTTTANTTTTTVLLYRFIYFRIITVIAQHFTVLLLLLVYTMRLSEVDRRYSKCVLISQQHTKRAKTARSVLPCVTSLQLSASVSAIWQGASWVAD